jgi:outer membrane protein assembly factor BamB
MSTAFPLDDAAASLPSDQVRSAAPPRVWPPVVMTILYWAVYAGAGFLELDNFQRFLTRLAALGVFLLAFLTWWAFSNALPWTDRLIVVAVAAASIAASIMSLDSSLRGLEVAAVIYAVPAMLTAWSIWLFITRSTVRSTRRNGMLVLAILSWAWTPLVRLDGLKGAGNTAFHWRWTPTGEEQFLAERASLRVEPTAGDDESAEQAVVEPLVADEGDWPGFRGPQRDGVVHDVTIRTNWNEKPPQLVWKHRVGPGWSSIVVVDGRLFTQEQHGQNEAIVCYDAETGNELWSHDDANARFDEAMGGVGPRATPQFAEGRLYALGATGLLTCLDAASGDLKWQSDITKDGQGKAPYWGFCSSPLVVDGRVIVFAGGGTSGNPEAPNAGGDAAGEDAAKGSDGAAANKNTLLAYDAASGDLAWQAPSGTHSYSSAQLATIDGVTMLLFISDEALDAVDPATGDAYWSMPKNGAESQPSLQPRFLGESDFLTSFSPRTGLVRAKVTRGVDGWQVDRQWVTTQFKAYFNDMVNVGDALYGFDGDIFCSIDLNTGKRNWKGGRYGSGQVLLLADQPVLLVISEAGEAVLVAANSAKHEELGRFQAIEGKTWNHPTIVGQRLFVRNAEEMACYDLQ